MKKLLLLLPLFLVVLLQFPVSAADVPDPWKPFQFMMGQWVGVGSEKSNEGSGEFSLKLDLDQKILVRTNWARLASGSKSAAGALHQDLMIIYPQRGTGRFRADYYDNEGNVIHYGISFGNKTAVFESDEPGNPTRFKLTYELKPDGALDIKFAIAAPGKPFQTCLTGAAKRK